MSNMTLEKKQNRGWRALILLLVTLAVFSSAMRDIEKLQELTCSLEQMASAVTGHDLFSASAATIYAAESNSRPSLMSQQTRGEFNWSGRLGQGKTIEIKGLNGSISANGSSGPEVKVIANKHSRNSDVDSVIIKVIEHADGVTICATYPTTNPNRMTRCEPGSTKSQQNLDQVTSNTEFDNNYNVERNDVNVDFTVSVPAGVNFAAKNVNGEITAQSLNSNATLKTVNGGIKISTTGYADAKTVNGEISASIGDPNWAGSLNFKTVNGTINLDLPAGVSTSVQAKTGNGSINSDFPLTVLGKYGKRQVSGTIGAGGAAGRELNLKTVNGSINLRRIG